MTDNTVSDKTKLQAEYKESISTPLYKAVQLYCKYLNEYYIKENNTIHIIASIETLL
jgi:hypothetical protein